MDDRNTGFRLTGRHVLAGLLAFFGVVVTVNIVFVVLALGTFTGLTDRDSYRTGVSWNRQLETAETLRSLGWRFTLDPQVRPVAGSIEARSLILRVRIADTDGAPVDGLRLTGQARHPIAEAHDRPMTFAPAGPGMFESVVELPVIGDWTIRLTAERTDGPDYRLDRRVRIR